MVSRRDRATRVAGGRHQDRERPADGLAQPRHAGGQETRAKVLERGGRPVKQLQNAKTALRGQRHERSGEIEGFGRGRRQQGREVIVRDERRQHSIGDRRQLRVAGEGLRFDPGPGLRHVESAVRRQALQQSLGKSRGRVAIAGTGEAHQSATTRAPCD